MRREEDVGRAGSWGELKNQFKREVLYAFFYYLSDFYRYFTSSCGLFAVRSHRNGQNGSIMSSKQAHAIPSLNVPQSERLVATQ